MEKQFYKPTDIMKLTGLSKDSSYRLVNKLQTEYLKENPEGTTFQKLIPIDFFNKKMGINKEAVNK